MQLLRGRSVSKAVVKRAAKPAKARPAAPPVAKEDPWLRRMLTPVSFLAIRLSTVCPLKVPREPYSLAQHAVQLSRICEEGDATWALFFVVPQMYTGLSALAPSPEQVYAIIRSVFHLAAPPPFARLTLLHRRLLDSASREFDIAFNSLGSADAGMRMHCWSRDQAQQLFLERFSELVKKNP